MFEKARERHKDDEFRYLIGSIADKYEFCKKRNKIEYSDFLDNTQIHHIEKMLKEEKIKNYVLYGVAPETDRKVLLFYPEKIDISMLEKNYKNIFNVIKITLPVGLNYEHREYLSGIMKLGIKREKFGDIVVSKGEADIICLAEIANTLVDGLKGLTRFKKAQIEITDISKLTIKEKQFEEKSIIVSSIRLDNFVSEIAKKSRKNSCDIIEEGRVLLNYVVEYKPSKKLEIGDIITVRGKGKFIFDRIERTTRSDNIVVILKKYI